MRLVSRITSIVQWIVRRDRAEQGLDAELREYVEMATADKIAQGVPLDEARRQALVELGGIEPVKEGVRTARHGAWLDETARDTRYAFRMFARDPGFTAVVILTLALGIGANTAIFTLIDALMLRWLPVSNPQELVAISLKSSPAATRGGALSYPIARALADQGDVFSGVAAFSSTDLDTELSGVVTRVSGAMVNGGFYDALGVRPVAGRLLRPDDDLPGAPLVAVLGYGFWETQFARSPDAVGRALRIGGVPVTVVGVSPRGFTGASVGSVAAITIPIAALPQINPSMAPLLGAGNFWLRALARPRAGVAVAEAASRLNVFWSQAYDSLTARHWSASQRKNLASQQFYLAPGGTGYTFLRDIYRTPLVVLMAAVGLVLLIACANVASLLLARASARRREIAVRLAIGAGRRRIVRQLLVESTVLSVAGAAAGLGVAWLSSRVLVSVMATGPVRPVFDLTPNWHVLAFASAVAIATGIIFGIAPALHTSATAPLAAMGTGPRGSGRSSRWLPALVCGQVALSLVLLAGAGLFVRTLQNLRGLDSGFRADGVLVADLIGRRPAIPPSLIEEIRRAPGVTSASLSTHTPLNGSLWSEPAVPAGQEIPERDNAFFVGAGPHFFDTMGIQLSAGRDFTNRDSADAPAVAIVNEAYAQRFFGNQNPVGRHLAAIVRGTREDLEIVGLARNTHVEGLRATTPPVVYVAYAQLKGDLPASVSVRAAGRLGEIASSVKQTLQTALPDLPIDLHTLSEQVDATIVQERMLALLASAFGILALTLACVGLYGLLAYGVARQTKEIGIRIALGARVSRVVGLVLGRAGRLVLIGVAIGLPIAWLASRSVKSMLYNTTATDPAIAVGAVSVLTIAALLAAYVPARRAARVDPLVALRQD